MAEMEVPMEQTQEDMHHHAHHSTEPWIAGVALTSALIAALAAVTVLIAGKYADASFQQLLAENNAWSQYQAKSIKSNMLASKKDMVEGQHETLRILALRDSAVKAELEKQEEKWKQSTEKDEAKAKEYEHELEVIKEKAHTAHETAHAMHEKHETLAKGVTMFQVAIAVAAISVLSKQKPFWFVGMIFSCIGIYFLVMGVMH